jgi:hypothetical protein
MINNKAVTESGVIGYKRSFGEESVFNLHQFFEAARK